MVRSVLPRRMVAAALTVAAMIVTEGSAHAADLGLEVRASPGSRRALPRITIRVPPGAADAVRTVYVLSRVPDPPPDVRLTATVEDSQAVLSPSGRLVLSGRDSVVPVRITVPNPERAQTGTLVATSQDRGQTLAQIAVKRDPAAVISVDGADDAGLERISPVESTREAFTITSRADEAVTDLRIAVAPFRDQEGGQIVPDVTLDGAPLRAGAPYEVPSHGRRSLVVRAGLEVAGEYQGSIRLGYGRIVAELPLRIRRTRVPPTIALTSPGSVQTVTGRTTRFPLEIRETGGHTVVLPLPSLVLRRADGDRRFSQAPGEVTLDGLRVPVRLEPGEVRSVDVAVPGVQGPGEYTARISFGGEPEPKQATATLFVRRPVEIAVLVLLLGIAASEWARRRFSGPHLAVRRRSEAASLDGGLGRLVAGSAPVVEEQMAGLERAVPPPTNGNMSSALAAATDSVRGELIATRETLDRLAGADATRTSAWRTWMNAAADELMALIEHASELPGVEPSARERLRQRLVPDIESIRTENDPRLATERYRDASAHYLETAATGLAALTARDRRPDVGRLAEISVQAARAGDLARAWQGYIAAAHAWDGSYANVRVDTAARRGAHEAAEEEALAPAVAVVGPPAAVAGPSPRRSTGPYSRTTAATSAVIALAMVLVGVLVLYQPDRAWGTLADLLAMFAFAAGIHSVVVWLTLQAAQRDIS
jgi:hypothetical protein